MTNYKFTWFPEAGSDTEESVKGSSPQRILNFSYSNSAYKDKSLVPDNITKKTLCDSKDNIRIKIRQNLCTNTRRNNVLETGTDRIS